MQKEWRKSQGFYPTPRLLAKRLIHDRLLNNSWLPNGILEPAAGFGDFILETWSTLFEVRGLSPKQKNNLIANTILFENNKLIFKALQLNIETWCQERRLKSRPILFNVNFLLNGRSCLTSPPDNFLVVGNPPWDEFTTRKHDGLDTIQSLRRERAQEKHHFSKMGFKNVYQCFLSEVLKISSHPLSLIFVLPRQLLGDRSSQDLRKQMINTGKLNLTVYCNKDEPSHMFESVARTAEILCVDYRSQSSIEVNIRRGFDTKFTAIKPFGKDWTIPCPYSSHAQTQTLLAHILKNASLFAWERDFEITVSRGQVDYTNRDYSKAFNGRTLIAYKFEDAESTDVIINKILPDSRRKLKAAIIRSHNNLSDSMLRIRCKNEKAHPYLMLLLNSRPIELALRSVISNINLNNFRLLSLPIPPPNTKVLSMAEDLCRQCLRKKLAWEDASDQLAQVVYRLRDEQLLPLRTLFPDREKEKIAA